MCRFLEAALLGGQRLCLPKLASIALYLDIVEGPYTEHPEFHVGVPLAPEQGAQGVCNALGRLVAAGVLPGLRQACPFPHATHPTVACNFWEVKPAMRIVQVLLEPCVHAFDSEWRGGQGPRCDGAPAVEVQCRSVYKRGHTHITEAFFLRKPEHGSALSEAAQRAFGSLAVV